MTSSVPVNLQIENLTGTQANKNAAAVTDLPDRPEKVTLFLS
jgi:hypothetical protein